MYAGSKGQAAGLTFNKSVELKNGRGRSRIISPRTVLIVEDDCAVRQVIEDIISTLGLVSINANTAEEALLSFEQHADETICVLLDYGVPGMHALQLLTRFKERRADIPVILSSGYPESYINVDIPSPWIDGFIAKPYDSQTLIGALQNVLARRQRMADAERKKPGN